MSIIKWSNLSDVLLSLIGLPLLGQRGDENFDKILSVCGITLGDNIFEILLVIGV
jgi:hypothetical protein